VVHQPKGKSRGVEELSLWEGAEEVTLAVWNRMEAQQEETAAEPGPGYRGWRQAGPEH